MERIVYNVDEYSNLFIELIVFRLKVKDYRVRGKFEIYLLVGFFLLFLF